MWAFHRVFVRCLISPADWLKLALDVVDCLSEGVKWTYQIEFDHVFFWAKNILLAWLQVNRVVGIYRKALQYLMWSRFWVSMCLQAAIASGLVGRRLQRIGDMKIYILAALLLTQIGSIYVRLAALSRQRYWWYDASRLSFVQEWQHLLTVFCKRLLQSSTWICYAVYLQWTSCPNARRKKSPSRSKTSPRAEDLPEASSLNIS